MATLLKLGTRGYYATVNEFQGQIRVHIRKYNDGLEKGKVPTVYGVALSVDEFEELKNVLGDLSEMVSTIPAICSMTTLPGDEMKPIPSNKEKQQESSVLTEVMHKHKDIQYTLADQIHPKIQTDMITESPLLSKSKRRKVVRRKNKPYVRHLSKHDKIRTFFAWINLIIIVIYPWYHTFLVRNEGTNAFLKS